MGDVHLMIQTECTLFFEQNPYSFETVEGLAERLGRTPEVLRPALEKLESLSILSQINTGDRPLYRYNQPNIINVG